MSEIRELTKAEEQIIKAVWQLEKASIKEIIDQLAAPKPAYNTVATVLKVLKTKGFVDFESNANQYLYYPVITEKAYKRFAFDKVFDGYFSGSYHSLVSFLVEEKNLDQETQERLKQLADKLKDL
jgi:BlaI family penicillinase repressor